MTRDAVSARTIFSRVAGELNLYQAKEHFREHGYVVLQEYLDADDLRPAQGDLGLMFPTAAEYHAGIDSERNKRFADGAFSGIDLFPYESVEWSLLGLTPKVVGLAETLLGTTDIRLYEAHNWAKYGGTTEYEQPLHRDFGNHMMVVPSTDPRFSDVEIFIYIHDVPIDAGPTYVISQTATRHLPPAQLRFFRDGPADLYELEVAADGPAGTVLAYRPDTLHRGSTMTNPTGSRFVLKASYRTVSDIWFDKLGLSAQLGRNWHAFVNRATARQLELAGFPPRGHVYWTTATWSATQDRYPDADLSEFAPH